MQHKEVSNIFFKNWLQRSLTKLHFLKKITEVSNICYFWRIFRNTYQNTNWPVNIFVIIFWSKVKYSFLHDFSSEKAIFVQLKFKKSFQDSIRLFCNCRAGEIKLCFQCFKCSYSNASNKSLVPLNSLNRSDGSILSQYYSEISRIYLFGSTNFNYSINTIILNATIIKY